MMFSGILRRNFIVMGGNHPGKSLPSHQAVKTTFSDWSGKTDASRGKDTSESLGEVFPKVFRYIVISCLFIGIYLLYRVDSLKIISLKYVMYFDHIHLSIPSWSPPFLFPTYTRLLPSPSLLFYFLITSIFIPLPIALHNCVHSRIHKWENVQNLSFLT